MSKDALKKALGEAYDAGFLQAYRLAKLKEYDGKIKCTKSQYISTGDPCWCGSDNCTICVNCGDENHD